MEKIMAGPGYFQYQQKIYPDPAMMDSAKKNHIKTPLPMLDYIEGFYEGDTVKLSRSVADYSVKYGYWKDDKTNKYAGEAMSHKEMMDYAVGIKAKNRQRQTDPAPENTDI
jgi:hypothetical protein